MQVVMRLLVCICVGLSSLSYAFEIEPPQKATQAVDWADSSPRLNLSPHLRYLKEPAGEPLEWRAALNSAEWQEVDPITMVDDNKAVGIWAQVELINTGSTVRTRLVAPDYWSFLDMKLFLLGVKQPSLLVPPQQNIQASKPFVEVTLLPGQRARLLMRLSDGYWRHIEVDAWEKTNFERFQSKGYFLFSALIGATLVLFVMLIAHGKKILASLAVWIVLSLLLEYWYLGLLRSFVNWPSPTVFLLLGVLINCLLSLMTVHFMGLYADRIWRRWNWGLLVVTGVLVLMGTPFNLVQKASVLLIVLHILSNLVMVAVARLRDNRFRQVMAFALICNFGVLGVRVVVRYFQIADFDLPLSYLLFSIKVSIVIAVVVLFELKRRRELEDLRQSLELSKQSQLDDLQMEVGRRTNELELALMEARAANDAKREFLARISHDLRSPLTAILGNAYLLRRVGERTGRLAHSIQRSAEQMRTLVTDLLVQATTGNTWAVNLIPIYFHAMLEDVSREATSLCRRKNNKFRLGVEGEIPTVLLLDPKRVRQILTNLLDNAAKFTRHGLIELIVSVQVLPSSPGQDDSLELQLTVRDSGQGISSDELVKIFQKCYRAAPADGFADMQGVGLGLSIVYSWVERMGGTVEVSSTLGQGSTFYVRLPVNLGGEDQMTLAELLDDQPHLPILDGEGRHIWLAEDNMDLRQILDEELSSIGFEVLVFPNGEELLAQLRSPGVTVPRVVLTDLQMPKASGLAVLRGVREHWPNVPVVLLSATNMTVTASGIPMNGGFDAVLGKPLNFADLRYTLARLMQIDLIHDGVNTQPGSLETLDADAAASSATGMFVGQKPPAHELEQVRQWVTMGALTDLIEWAEDVQRRLPDCVEFGKCVLVLLESGRLHDLRDLCTKDSAS